MSNLDIRITINGQEITTDNIAGGVVTKPELAQDLHTALDDLLATTNKLLGKVGGDGKVWGMELTALKTKLERVLTIYSDGVGTKVDVSTPVSKS